MGTARCRKNLNLDCSNRRRINSPIFLATSRPAAFDRLMAVKWVPNAAKTIS